MNFINKLLFLTVTSLFCFSCKTTKQTTFNRTEKSFYNNGLVSKEEFINVNGNLDSLKTYYKDGKPNETFYYNNNNEYHGKCYQLDKQGDTLVTWQFVNGFLKKRLDYKLEFNKINEKSVKRAQQSIQKINDLNKTSNQEIEISSRIVLAQHRLRLKNYTLALDELLKLETENLSSYKKKAVYSMLGVIYSVYDNVPSTIHYKAKTIEFTKKNVQIQQYNLGAYLLHIKSYDMGLYYINLVLNSWGNHAFSHWTLGKHYSEIGEYKKALEHINIAYKQEKSIISHSSNNSHTDVKTIKGFIHYKLGDSESGIKYLLEAINEKPNNSYAYRNLGIINSDLGKHEKACSYLQKSRELGYEKIFERDDLNFYIMRSCHKTTIKKTEFIPKNKKQVDFNIDKNKNAIELASYPLGTFEYQIFNHKNIVIRNGTTNNKIINLSNLTSGYYSLKIVNNTNPKTFNFIRH